MWRWASLTLSATLAAAAGSRPSGSGTSMPSAKGTASSSATAPPQWPPISPKPYIEIGGTLVQLLVWPARHIAQVPQLIWKGTTTRSPGLTEVTRSPMRSTSATHSWPKQNGIGKGVWPRLIGRSMSQVAIAIGWTTAPSGPGSGGIGIERQCMRPPGVAMSERIFGRVGRRRSLSRSVAAARRRRARTSASRSIATTPAYLPRGRTMLKPLRIQGAIGVIGASL